MLPQELIILTSIFSLGLFGGFSHCTGMCGPFVLTQVSNRLNQIPINQATNFKKISGIALLPYHFGRITSYCFISGVSAFLIINLKNITGFKFIAGILLIMAAIMIFSSTINKIQLPFKIKLLKICPSFFLKKVKNLLTNLFLNPTGFKNYFLGILLGFIPCGLVYSAIAIASSLDKIWLAILAMLVFGIGTIPALFLTACSGYWFFDGIKKHLKIFTKTILLINVFTLLVMAFGLIFNQI